MHLRETLTLEEPEKQMNPYDVVVFFPFRQIKSLRFSQESTV